MHRGVDQSPNHQQVDMRPSLTQLPKDKKPIHRHTSNSGRVLDQQTGSSTGGRQMTGLPSPSYPTQPHSPLVWLGTQQIFPQLGQANPTSKPCSIPPTSSRYDPPASVTSTTSPPPPPSMSQPSQPPQPPQPPQPSHPSQPSQPSQPSPQLPDQPATTDVDEPSPTLTETVDTALEPLRLGFENVLTHTTQNVHQVMSKMQIDLTRLVSKERRKNSYLMHRLVNSGEKLKGQERAMEELKRENDSLKESAVENGRLKMMNTQKLTVIDTLNRDNDLLRSENKELRKRNDEVREALAKTTGSVLQYKKELDKARADIDTLRKSREASALSPQTTAPSDRHREMARLHAERERERIFNDAVKQLRALTALEDSLCSNLQNADTTRERFSEETVIVETARTLSDGVGDRDRRTQSALLEVSTSNQNLSSPSFVAEVHDTIIEHPGPDSREIVDVDMSDDDNITVVPPSPVSSLQARSRKPLTVCSRIGRKRNRDQYQEGDASIEEPVMVEERMRVDPTQFVRSPSLVEREVIHVDVQNSEVGEISLDLAQKDVDISINISNDKTRHKGGSVVTDGTQVSPQIERQTPMIPSSNKSSVEDLRPTWGRWSYTHFRDDGTGATPIVTQQSTIISPSTQDQQLPKRDTKFERSLEKNLDTTAAERRKVKAKTKKFP